MDKKKVTKIGGVSFGVIAASALAYADLVSGIRGGDEVWLHAPCVKTTVIEGTDPKTKKKVQKEICSKQGPIRIYKAGLGPDVEKLDATIGAK